MHHGNANLRNKQGGENFISNLCTEVQRVGRGKGEVTVQLLLVVHIHLATSVHLAAAQRLPNVVPAALTVLVVIGHSLIIAYFLDILFLPICS